MPPAPLNINWPEVERYIRSMSAEYLLQVIELDYRSSKNPPLSQADLDKMHDLAKAELKRRWAVLRGEHPGPIHYEQVHGTPA